MIKVKQVIKNNVLQTTPTQLFNSYEEVITWLNTNLVNIFSYTGSAIATTSTTDKWIIDMYCLECDTTKDCLLYLIQNDQQVKDALCANQCLPAIPFNVTNITSTDSNWWAYDCGNPILTWTASSGATSYDIFEWATLLWNTVSTTFTAIWASVWSHTYSVVAKNSWGSASWVSTTVVVTACLTAPWNVTGTINVYNSGTATNYTCGLWFDVNFTDVSGATYYQLFEWATQIGSNSATSNFVVTGQTAGSHTYTIRACNWVWCSSGTNFTVVVVACGVWTALVLTDFSQRCGGPAITYPHTLETWANTASGSFGSSFDVTKIVTALEAWTYTNIAWSFTYSNPSATPIVNPQISLNSASGNCGAWLWNWQLFSPGFAIPTLLPWASWTITGSNTGSLTVAAGDFWRLWWASGTSNPLANAPILTNFVITIS